MIDYIKSHLSEIPDLIKESSLLQTESAVTKLMPNSEINLTSEVLKSTCDKGFESVQDSVLNVQTWENIIKELQSVLSEKMEKGEIDIKEILGKFNGLYENLGDKYNSVQEHIVNELLMKNFNHDIWLELNHSTSISLPEPNAEPVELPEPEPNSSPIVKPEQPSEPIPENLSDPI